MKNGMRQLKMVEESLAKNSALNGWGVTHWAAEVGQRRMGLYAVDTPWNGCTGAAEKINLKWSGWRWRPCDQCHSAVAQDSITECNLEEGRNCKRPLRSCKKQKKSCTNNWPVFFLNTHLDLEVRIFSTEIELIYSLAGSSQCRLSFNCFSVKS